MAPKINWKTGIVVWMGLCLLTLGAFSSPSWAGAAEKPRAELLDIQSKRTADLLQLELTVTQPIQIRPSILEKPKRLVLDLSPCRLGLKQPPAIPDDPLVSDFRVSQFNPYTTRIVLIVPQTPSFQVYPSKDSPLIWQVDLAAAPKKKAAPEIIPVKSLPRAKEVLSLNEFKQEQGGSLKPTAPVPPPRVTFDFYNADLHNVFRLLGEVGQVNIIVGEEVKGKATLSLKEIPWDQALDMVLNSNRLIKIIDGKNIRISTLKEYVEVETIRRKESQSVVREQQDVLKTEQELLKTEDALQKVQEGRLPLLTKHIKLNYIAAEDMKRIIDEIWGSGASSAPNQSQADTFNVPTGYAPTSAGQTPGAARIGKGIVAAIKQTNSLFIRSNRIDMDQIEQLIKATDQPTPQVMIEARIVEAGSNFARDFGLQWGGAAHYSNPYAPLAGTLRGFSSDTDTRNSAVNLPIGPGPALNPFTGMAGIGLTIASANLNIDVRLQAFEQLGDVKIISSPKVLTLDNKKAIIKQGQKIPVTTRTDMNTFSTSYIDAALKLEVTPHIAQNGKKITMNIKLNNDSVALELKDSLGNYGINTQEASLELNINDGETLVLGGIKSRGESTGEKGVPGLKDVPVLGWLFKTKEKSTADKELLIFITPKIIIPLKEKFAREG
jgi:type IV pilus assembly protein PilQ